jgi:hypothetical protein
VSLTFAIAFALPTTRIVLDAAAATRITIQLRARAIDGKPWIELLRFDDRAIADEDFEKPFQPFAGLSLVKMLADRVGGEASLSAGRPGVRIITSSRNAPCA